ncbi:MAG: hypothetical protein JW722_07530 [Demequinaceae bacterium]|nr:hypothetical protein [Demequinaceae bacterium]
MITGAVIADRYVLRSIAHTGLPLVESWHAEDTRLGVPVLLLLVEEPGRRAIRPLADQARTARHAQLARLVEVGLVESDDPDHAGRPFIALERPSGLSAADLIGRRILPTPVARALVGEAARAVEAAASLGLRHGAISPELLTVTDRGRVILAGAGVASGLVALDPDRKAVTERDDARALSLLFVRAITGMNPDEVTAEDLPRDLTRAERDLAFVVSSPSGRPSLEDLFKILGTWDPLRLRSLRLDQASFPRRLAPPGVEPDAIPPEAEAPRDESAVLTVFQEELAAQVGVADATALVEVLAPEEGWGLDELEELVSLEEAPTLAEAVLGFLHRRFPSSGHIERLLERAKDRTLAGPRFDATPWLLLGGLIVVIIVGIMSLQWTTGPFTPTVDLNNPPSHAYPSYTFGPTASPSSDS